jgi:hypothetical protein
MVLIFACWVERTADSPDDAPRHAEEALTLSNEHGFPHWLDPNPTSMISHSITSSARASSEGGTVSPSAFAVLRLMTSSNLVLC